MAIGSFPFICVSWQSGRKSIVAAIGRDGAGLNGSEACQNVLEVFGIFGRHQIHFSETK
jgi:hypothetical protein